MRLTREVRILRAHSMITTVLLAILGLSAFRRGGRETTTFDEIQVHRINVVENDGHVRLVISNSERSPAPLQRGKPFLSAGGGRPGLIFYNDEQTEDGGLVFAGHRDTTSGRYEASGSLTFDHYEQDQTVALQYVDGNGRRRAGLAVWDRPTNMTGMEFDARMRSARAIADSATRADSMRIISRQWSSTRLYAGRFTDGSALVLLADGNGNARLRLQVDSAGSPRIQFLDASGKVTRTLDDG
jgi:hypothetical protein